MDATVFIGTKMLNSISTRRSRWWNGPRNSCMTCTTPKEFINYAFIFFFSIFPVKSKVKNTQSEMTEDTAEVHMIHNYYINLD